jgi:Transglycosylase SLT domain
MREGGVRRAPRKARWHRATALLPLVVLSGALSASAATNSDGEQPASAGGRPALPSVPRSVFDQPASVAMPGAAMPGGLSAGRLPSSGFDFFSGDAPSAYRQSMSSSVAGIPAAALQAYQRAAAILNQADPACNLDWTLIGAIGRVESDHGRYGGNALDAQGKARPGIYGIALDGSGGTARILDTDGGAYDHDAVYDRAVGPMQFIPSTWSMTGVDADQDGVKDPQDIDDAATATAVYLCAGSDDLSTTGGQRSAVYRYNHSTDYVNLVLSIAAAYAGGDFTAVPNGTPSSTTLYPADFTASGRPADTRNAPTGGTRGGSTSGGTASGGSVGGGSGGGSSDSDSGGSGGGSSGGSGDGGGSGSGGGGSGGGGTLDPAPAPTPDSGDTRDTVDRVRKRVGDTTDEVTKRARDTAGSLPGVG